MPFITLIFQSETIAGYRLSLDPGRACQQHFIHLPKLQMSCTLAHPETYQVPQFRLISIQFSKQARSSEAFNLNILPIN